VDGVQAELPGVSIGQGHADEVPIFGAEAWGGAVGEGWDAGMNELLEQLEGGAQETERRRDDVQGTGEVGLGLDWLPTWNVEGMRMVA
jgi:hypothetical protein